MSTKNTANGRNDARSNFGAWGWFTIFFAFMTLMIAGNLMVDSMNITVGAFAALRGWEMGVLLSWSTVAGLCALFGAGILSTLCAKIGVKKVYAFSIAVVGICCMLWGSVTSIGQYAVIIILVNVFGDGMGFVASTALLASWFPKKKGLAMGWATIGFQASAILLLPVFQYLLDNYDLKAAYRFIGIILFIMFFVCIFFLKDNPEDRGVAPDNDKSFSIEEFQRMHEKAKKLEKEYGMSMGRLLKTKQTWQIGITNGLVQLAITCLIVQFIPNMTEAGFSQGSAIAIYSGASIVGAVGSYLWGVLDQKTGVKRASVWMCIAHIAGCFMFGLTAHHIGGKPVAVVAAFIVGTILGVSSNYVGSFTATVFGRYGYSSAFAFIIMIVTGLRSLGYSLIGVINTATGTNTVAYYIAAILSLIAMVITIKTDDTCISVVESKSAVKLMENN